MKNKPNDNMQCQTIIRLNSMLPLANYLSNGVWIITTQKDVMFSVVSQETKSKQSIVIVIRAPIAKVKLELTCSAFNDYLTLLSYYHTQTEYLVEDTLSDLIKRYNFSAVKIWKTFHRALPEYKELHLPK